MSACNPEDAKTKPVVKAPRRATYPKNHTARGVGNTKENMFSFRMLSWAQQQREANHSI